MVESYPIDRINHQAFILRSDDGARMTIHASAGFPRSGHTPDCYPVGSQVSVWINPPATEEAYAFFIFDMEDAPHNGGNGKCRKSA